MHHKYLLTTKSLFYALTLSLSIELMSQNKIKMVTTLIITLILFKYHKICILKYYWIRALIFLAAGHSDSQSNSTVVYKVSERFP